MRLYLAEIKDVKPEHINMIDAERRKKSERYRLEDDRWPSFWATAIAALSTATAKNVVRRLFIGYSALNRSLIPPIEPSRFVASYGR